MTLETYVVSLVFSYILVFARLGSALVFMPAFGEVQIPVRARLTFGLVLCAALLPVTPVQGMLPGTPLGVALMLAFEVTIGLWIGLTARIILSALQFAGFQVGQVSGLANAFGPSFGSFEGATMVATLMLISAVTMIFITDTHHMILRALLGSYEVFPPGQLMLDDLSDQIIRAGAQSLYIGAAISAPFFVMGVILNLGMGLANRMMPQLPVFFVAASLLIAAGLLILAVAMPPLLDFFISQFQGWLASFRF